MYGSGAGERERERERKRRRERDKDKDKDKDKDLMRPRTFSSNTSSISSFTLAHVLGGGVFSWTDSI